jgi:hypothetical protein
VDGCFLLRAVLIMPLFVIKFLLVWLSPFRLSILRPTLTATLLIFIFLAVALIEYYIFWEPCQEHDSGESTVGMEEEESQVCMLTEHAPLMGANTTMDTDMVPQIYFSDLQRQAQEDHLEADDHFSLGSSSPYYVDMDDKLTRFTIL